MAEQQKTEEFVHVRTDPTKHWCRKMRTHFVASVGTKGYITEEEVMEQTRKVLEIYPELDADEQMKNARHTWIHVLNSGMKPPPGYRLTESQFIQNMWLEIHQPSFKRRIREMTTKVMEQLDKDKKGYITKNEWLKITSKQASEEQVQKIYDSLDVNKTGKVTQEVMEKAYTFFFTDTDDEEHPLNLLRGPLID